MSAVPRSYILPTSLIKNRTRWNAITLQNGIVAADLLDLMLDLNPDTRISAKQMLQHPYLKEEEEEEEADTN